MQSATCINQITLTERNLSPGAASDPSSPVAGYERFRLGVNPTSPSKGRVGDSTAAFLDLATAAVVREGKPLHLLFAEQSRVSLRNRQRHLPGRDSSIVERSREAQTSERNRNSPDFCD